MRRLKICCRTCTPCTRWAHPCRFRFVGRRQLPISWPGIKTPHGGSKGSVGAADVAAVHWQETGQAQIVYRSPLGIPAASAHASMTGTFDFQFGPSGRLEAGLRQLFNQRAQVAVCPPQPFTALRHPRLIDDKTCRLSRLEDQPRRQLR